MDTTDPTFTQYVNASPAANSPSQLKLYQLAALGLVFFSFFMSALVSERVFERLPHLEDELAYIFQARIFAAGDVVIDIPQPRRAYWQPFVIDFEEENTRFGKYSPGWPLILSMGVLMGQMWVINAFAAAITVALVYRLGYEIFSANVGLIAAALTAFSPMSLLLNATFMSHTTSLCLFTLFMYAYWRIEKRRNTTQWGIIAGLSLGLLVISRPLTAIGVTVPFILWSVLRIIHNGIQSYEQKPEQSTLYAVLWQTIKPLAILGILTLTISLFIPFFNNSATNEPGRNLYLEWWTYDQPGFGECCGRSGHTIVKGMRHTRFDLSLTAADLFGWQMERSDNFIGWEWAEITPALQDHLRIEADYWPPIGLSLLILPLGLLIGFRKWWMRIWLLGALYWLLIPLINNADFLRGIPYVANGAGELIPDSEPIWRWLALGAGWLLLPFVGIIFVKDNYRQTEWTWLFLCVFVGLVGVHLAYWVGSQRYSTRYYFEALTALTIIAAVGFNWIIQMMGKATGLLGNRKNTRLIGMAIGYGLLSVALLWSLYEYSTPRINALYEFNNVRGSVLDDIEERRVDDDKPLLVLLNGEIGTVRWRAYGSLMAITDPYFENDIIGAWNYALNDPEIRESILARFPDREIIEMAVYEESAWFIDGTCEIGEEISVSPDCNESTAINIPYSPDT